MITQETSVSADMDRNEIARQPFIAKKMSTAVAKGLAHLRTCGAGTCARCCHHPSHAIGLKNSRSQVGPEMSMQRIPRLLLPFAPFACGVSQHATVSRGCGIGMALSHRREPTCCNRETLSRAGNMHVRSPSPAKTRLLRSDRASRPSTCYQ